MITLTREEAQQVLDALEWAERRYSFAELELFNRPIETIRAKLSEPEPEPVAIVQQEAIGKGQVLWVTPASQVQDGTPLYTAPPQREWVGLTDEELEFYTEELGQGELGRGVLRAVVDFLKEKNSTSGKIIQISDNNG